MKTFNIFCKNSEQTELIKKKYVDYYTRNGYTYQEHNADYCFIIGGDGAVLRAVHEHFSSLDKTKFIVIHDGTLGFFADYKKEDMELIRQTIEANNYDLKLLPLLKLEVVSKDNKVSTEYAFNEFTIQNFTQTMIADVLIDNRHLETFRGTGFCISTPSGSTAYNKALKGAVIYRDVDAIQLTEIASINHNKYHSLNAPLVMGRKHIITLKPIAQSNISITADFKSWADKNHWLASPNDDIKEINCYLSKLNAQFILPQDACYIKRLNRAFII